MPLTYKKKTCREQPAIDNIKEAVKEVIEKKQSLRATAEKWNISKTSLSRYVSQIDKLPGADFKYTSKHTSNQIFTTDEEQMLVDYILTSSQMHYGLSKVNTRSLSFEYAVANGKKISKKWEETKLAGEDWLRGFLKRHPELSIRKPEAISLSRATSFNKKMWVIFLIIFKKF